MTPEDLAQLFHETYERLAPQYSYTTRKESAKPWSAVPENNRNLMIATCAEVLHDERFARLEALESLAKYVILPLSRYGATDARMEEEGRFARDWTDKEVEENMQGTSFWDDPPEGWRKPKMLTYARGYLVGRGIVGGNLGQYYWRFIRATTNPVTYWRRWRLGYLDMHRGGKCLNADCQGGYEVDEARVMLVCEVCRQSTLTYEQLVELQDNE